MSGCFKKFFLFVGLTDYEGSNPGIYFETVKGIRPLFFFNLQRGGTPEASYLSHVCELRKQKDKTLPAAVLVTQLPHPYLIPSVMGTVCS